MIRINLACVSLTEVKKKIKAVRRKAYLATALGKAKNKAHQAKYRASAKGKACSARKPKRDRSGWVNTYYFKNKERLNAASKARHKASGYAAQKSYYERKGFYRLLAKRGITKEAYDIACIVQQGLCLCGSSSKNRLSAVFKNAELVLLCQPCVNRERACF